MTRPSALPRPTLITAIDLDSASSSPANQAAVNAFDNSASTKYLNLGGINSGFTFTYGLPTQLSSFLITTANDLPARDPASYQLYGFNNGSWKLLTSGSLQLPNARLTNSSPVALPSLPSLTQYRVIFPTLRANGNSMQIADLKLYGTQSAALPRPTSITAIDLDSTSSSPPTQQAGKAFDNTSSTKYLNFGGINSGVSFTYRLPTRLSSFVITTANDQPARDPASYRIFGFSNGSWQLLTSGSLKLPNARLTTSSPVSLPALPSLTQYRVIFPTLKASGNFMQIAELKLYGTQSAPPGPTPPPVISLAVSPASLPEDSPNTLLYTFSRTGPTTRPLTVSYAISGTADASDYTGATPGPGKTITFAAGSATATLTLDPTADTSVEPDETVSLTLAAATGYAIGPSASAIASINNDDTTPPPGSWTYNWANASTLGNIPSILKASVAMPSPRAGEQPLALTALRIDLRDPAIRLTSTGRRSDWANNTIETTTETSRQYISRSRNSGQPIVAAINTAPFELNLANQFQSVPTNIRGFAVSEGQLVSSTDYNTDTFKSTFLYDPIIGARIENKASSLPAPKDVTYPAPAAEVALASTLKVATSGFGIVLNNGVVSGDQISQNARSALGLTADGRYLTMLTVDRVAKLGPSLSWQGATDYDVGTILKGFGSSMGINVDGGGSTQLAWWNPTTHQAELLSNPLAERYVGSSLGVLYQPI
jgi:hypothetical protein